MSVDSVDPRTGAVRRRVSEDDSEQDVRRVCAAAKAAYEEVRTRPRRWRAELLRSMADALEADCEPIVAAADAETALGGARLSGELTRTCYQLRLFAETVEDGGFLEATIDHAGPTDMGPRPDLRRMLVPLGPVAVFGASNFPLAFSVPGGDTASALAAGCPVVVKVHESHPETAELCGRALVRGAERSGAPHTIVQLVFGRAAGAALVQDPDITAVGFTGSLDGGSALMALANARPTPIPFYGELSSLNPLVVTAAAARERGEKLAADLVGSFTLGAGQFCTKPGLVFVPTGPDGDTLVDAAAREIRSRHGAVMLNAGIAAAYRRGLAEIAEEPGVSTRAAGTDAGEFAPAPALLEVDADQLGGRLGQECFGPEAVVARYRDEDTLLTALRRLPGSLTAGLHVAEGEEPPSRVLSTLEQLAGRILFNGYPTGVAVSWAQHHGGPWPATSTLHTSVGMTATRRFMRPIAWQDAPQSALPVELRDQTDDLPRRVDGVLVLASDGR